MKTKLFSALALVGALTAMPSFASADQCSFVSKDDAVEGAQLIALYGFGGHYVDFCEPCGDKPTRVDVSSVSIAHTGVQDFWQVSVNGKDVDLAYAFIGDEYQGYENLSKAVGCPSEDVSAVLDGDLNPVRDDEGGKFDLSGGDSAEAGGCSVGGQAGGQAGLLLLGALGFIAMRRRKR